MSEPKIIHCNIFNPTTSIGLFKDCRNDKAECNTITCSNCDCPLLKKKQCYMLGGLGYNRCPYGTTNREVGFTKRANGFSKWIRDREERYKCVPCLSRPENKIAFIGEYVLLPYTHMALCQEVPFVKHGRGLNTGMPFIFRADWSVDHVITLIKFRPQALFGGEIVSYQKEEVPLFLAHLREEDKEMWAQLIEKMPHLNTKPNHVGRKAVLKSLNAPIEWTERRSDKYPITWKWNGETLTTTSYHAYERTWGNIDLQSFILEGKPKEQATITVQSNDWVNESTEFVD